MMDVISQISLRNPWWLLLALQPLLLWLLARVRRHWQQDDFADASLLPWVLSQHNAGGMRQGLRQLALVSAWCLFALAMAGPRTLQGIIGNSKTDALTLQLIVDESYSMSARDVLPTRLQRVKLELHDLVDRLQGVRMGVIVYAARAHVMIPATSDKSVLRHTIDMLRVRELPTEGSDLASALRMAQQQLKTTKSPQRAILLISDGELSNDTAQGQQQLLQMVANLRRDHIHLYTLGVGTSQGTALLDDQNGWLQQAGRTVVTRLHAARLQTLAQAGNGAYAVVADDDSDWHTLYDEGIAGLRVVPRDSDAGTTLIWHDLSAWFVLPGIVLLLLAYIRLPHLANTSSATLLLCVIFVAGWLPSPSSQAAEDSYAAAYAIYHAGNFHTAARRFARLPGYAARMGEAASLYQLHQYPQAATVYIQAALDANTDKQRAAALFNLGNSYFKQQVYDRAAATYRDALRYAPTLAAIKTNLAYAEALLESTRQHPVAPVKRAGTGHHMAPAAPGTDVGKGRVSIAESENQPPEQRPQDVDTTPQQANKHSLLQQAKPVTEQIVLDKDVQWTYDISHARDIQAQDSQFSVNESNFWQRLFEAEEDYPAPRAKPEVLPGVAPW